MTTTETTGRENETTAEGPSVDAVVARLEDGVRLLVGRTAELVRELGGERTARDTLGDGFDPVAMSGRMEKLESENQSLARHAAFLETRIRKLLSRVRYGSGR